MSQSQRLSDELVNAAKAQAKKFHRSTAQQIEHWARLGQLMEPALSFPVREKATELTRARLEETLAGVDTPDGRACAQTVIRRTTGDIVSTD